MLAQLRIASHSDFTEWSLEDVPVEYVTLPWLQEVVVRLSADGKWSDRGRSAGGDTPSTDAAVCPDDDAKPTEAAADATSCSVVVAAAPPRRHKVIKITSQHLAQLPPQQPQSKGGISGAQQQRSAAPSTFRDAACVLLRLNGRRLHQQQQQTAGGTERLITTLERHLGGPLQPSTTTGGSHHGDGGGQSVVSVVLHAYPSTVDAEAPGIAIPVRRQDDDIAASPTATADGAGWGAAYKEGWAALSPRTRNTDAATPQSDAMGPQRQTAAVQNYSAVRQRSASPLSRHAHNAVMTPSSRYRSGIVVGGDSAASALQRQQGSNTTTACAAWDLREYHSGQAYLRSRLAAEERFSSPSQQQPSSSPTGGVRGDGRFSLVRSGGHTGSAPTPSFAARFVSVSLHDDEGVPSPFGGPSSPGDAISPPQRTRRAAATSDNDAYGGPTTPLAATGVGADHFHHHLHHIRISLDD